MRTETTRAEAAEWDRFDPLAGFRDRFVVTDPEVIYLDGNSLGRMPAATPAYLAQVLGRHWGEQLVASWDSWLDWGSRVGDRLAEHVLGARPGEVVVSDSTSVNLYKLALAAIDDAGGRRTVVMDTEDFPSDRYLVEGIAQRHDLAVRTVSSDLDRGLDLDHLRAALDRDVALVVLSLVNYRSSALADLAEVNRAAAAVGARVLWDLSHAVGAVPIDLAGTGTELAVGCTYKYLNGGPGSPAFLYVRTDLQARLRQPVWGWFGQQDQFEMGAGYRPVERIERFLVGTPPVLSLACLEPALDVIADAGLDRLRDKGMRLGELVVELAGRWLADRGFTLASPASAERRGSHVTLHHADAARLCRELTAAKVICDFRTPDRLRISPAPLYTRFADVWDAMDRLRRITEPR